ncbi:hypothetical protein E2C01_021367 [Portunus trituberculatus]|uniref:Uncharacterized protein n=1 Tax=Portunus trituberculatus TaxID=210409 RepID=A0A5B7E4H2_PORTR|nr:hypothetical protein [Portunus trituberculatus]
MSGILQHKTTIEGYQLKPDHAAEIQTVFCSFHTHLLCTSAASHSLTPATSNFVTPASPSLTTCNVLAFMVSLNGA